mgnify:CR=1 FL=1
MSHPLQVPDDPRRYSGATPDEIMTGADEEKFQYDSMPWLSPNPHILMLLRPRLQRKENNV